MTEPDDRLLQRAREDCAICGRPFHKHSGGAPNTCPMIATYRPLTRLDAEVIARVKEAMVRHKGCALEQGITSCAILISDVKAMLEALK